MEQERYDEATSLDIISGSITHSVINAMQAALVIGATTLLFHHKRELFSNNPANTLLYMSFEALEERSVVDIAGVIKDENKCLQIPAEIRGKVDLIHHRDALSHPTLIKWGKRSMQQFYDERRPWRDLRPALVWDMQRSINERLRAFGKRPRLETIDVTPGMVVAHSGILRLSMTGPHQENIPTDKQMFESLETFRAHYLDFLVEHADGKRAPTKGS